MATPTVPGSPTPLTHGSPAGAHHDLARPPPVIPDHELLCPIGRGAYGEVWLARNVVGTLRAVKVVHRQDFGDDHPFEREFKGIQRFEPISRSHPGLVNILQIGLNGAEGYFYYVMELADEATALASDQPSVLSKQTLKTEAPATAGKSPSTDNRSLITTYSPHTLRHDLRLRGRLPVKECVGIGLALTSALEHLHRSGLVHRDIKPSNIIYVKGQPKLADIGLVAEAGDCQSIVGTEGYLAPEGPGTVAADIYSLGKVLYELGTGQDRRQFPDLPSELKEWPESKALRQLNEVVLKACARDVARRYRSAEEMRSDLARLEAGKSVRWRARFDRATARTKHLAPVLAAAVLLLLALPWVTRQQKSRLPAVPTEKASVFVLPFRAEGSNGVPADLCGRITDAFIDSLAVVEGVRRSPRKSGWIHQDEKLLLRWLAETNDKRHVLTGRIGVSNDIVTLNLRLFTGGEEQPAWAESLSRTTNELIALERLALAKLASRLDLKVTEVEQRRIGLLLTNNLEALGWMRRALAVYDAEAGTTTGHEEVQKRAGKAKDLDPEYIEADFLDALVYRDLSMERRPREAWPNVYARMKWIHEHDGTHAGALDQLTGYTLFYSRDWPAAYELVELQTAAGDPCTRLWIGAMWYRSYGWLEEARALQEKSEKSEKSEPVDFTQRFHMAASRWVGPKPRYHEGIQIARRTLEMHPGNLWGYISLAHGLVANGEFEEGLQVIEQAQEVWPRQEMIALRGYAYARMGQPGKAREVLRELMDLQRTSPYLQPYFVARVYAAMGENAAALDWLEKADADRSEYLLFADVGGLRTDPAWDGLKDEPRYWKICKGLGLGKTQWPRPKAERVP